MKEADLINLIEKTQDVTAIAFLRDVISFVKEIKPVLENINSSISENVQKMPAATHKLSKVTEATEVATTEILNVVDGLFAKTSQIKKNYQSSLAHFRTQRTSAIDSLRSIRAGVASKLPDSPELHTIDALISNLEQSYAANAEFQELEKQHGKLITELNDDLTAIMMSLQVQDITSQQIAAVNHLLETIQVRLAKILRHFQESELAEIIAPEGFKEDINISNLHRSIAFDPDALDAINKKESRQDDVDALLEKVSSGTLSDEDMKEDTEDMDIDALFANAGASTQDVASSEEISGDDIDALFASAATENQEEVSQDDIDALFGGGSGADEASDDDIDALFAK